MAPTPPRRILSHPRGRDDVWHHIRRAGSRNGPDACSRSCPGATRTGRPVYGGESDRLPRWWSGVAQHQGDRTRFIRRSSNSGSQGALGPSRRASWLRRSHGASHPGEPRTWHSGRPRARQETPRPPDRAGRTRARTEPREDHVGRRDRARDTNRSRAYVPTGFDPDKGEGCRRATQSGRRRASPVCRDARGSAKARNRKGRPSVV